MTNKKYVAYYRVSTADQGASQLGLDAQRNIVRNMFKDDVVAEFTEVHTGTDLVNCFELRKAIDYCKANNCIFVIAKSDRFRNAIEGLQTLEELGGVDNFITCDAVGANKLVLGVLWLSAEDTAIRGKKNTKDALAQAKKKGVKMGRSNPKYGQSDGHKERMAEGRKQAAINKNRNVIESEKTVKLARILKQIVPEYNANLLPEPLFFLNWNDLNISLTTDQKHLILDGINTHYPEIADRKINGEIVKIKLTTTDAHNMHVNLINSIKKYNENQIKP